jgi:hypothetical protein
MHCFATPIAIRLFGTSGPKLSLGKALGISFFGFQFVYMSWLLFA